MEKRKIILDKKELVIDKEKKISFLKLGRDKILSVDGASRQTGAGVGLQLKAPIGERIEQTIRLDFPASNNEAEYEEILAGIDLAISISSEKIIIQSDS